MDSQQTNIPTSKGRNVVIFVADGLRLSSVNSIDAPTLSTIRDTGVNFVNSHSLFSTFTTPNAIYAGACLMRSPRVMVTIPSMHERESTKLPFLGLGKLRGFNRR